MPEGALLSLQWSQVRFQPKAELFLPAQKTKRKTDRVVPMSITFDAFARATAASWRRARG
jgi:hypothetical protein